jgi:ribonuclease-3
MNEERIAALETALGYCFLDRTLLVHALTHSSRKAEVSYSNERLEFLGDAVLGCAVSECLYRQFPDHAEGALTRVKSVAVSRASLARAAKEMDLGAYLIVAKGVALPPAEKRAGAGAEAERAHNGLPASLVSNAFEAIIGAIYLDGGWEAAREFILQRMRGEIEHACKLAAAHNFKSALQELVQREMGATPEYRVVAEEGPDHVKRFSVVTTIRGREYGVGRGNTKKAAEQQSAELTLEMLEAERAGATEEAPFNEP